MPLINVTVQENTITVSETTNQINVSTTQEVITLSSATAGGAVSNANIRAAVSAVDSGGDGSFSYDEATGVFTYLGPSASQVRAHFSNTAPILYDVSTGVFSVDPDELFSNADANAWFTTQTTDGLAEGSSNLYLNGVGTTDNLTEGSSRLYLNGAGTTDDLTQGTTNLYLSSTTTANVQLKRFQETVVDAGNVSGAVSFDLHTGTVFKAQLVGNVSSITLANATYGSGATLILTQDYLGNHVLDTSSMTTWDWAEDYTTLNSTPDSSSMLSVVYDGARYRAAVTRFDNFASNVDVAIANYTGAITNLTGNVTTTANVSGAYILGDGSQLSNVSSLTNAQVKTYIESSGLNATANLTTTANVNAAILTTTGNATIGANLNVAGNLEVTGNINYREVTDLLVQDQTITLNYGNATAQDAQIIVDRSGSALANVDLKWNETTDNWTFTNDGSTYLPIATSTTDLAEGTNLYYTQARFDTAFSNKTTGDLTEGSNLYWEVARGNAQTLAYTGAIPNLTGNVITTANISGNYFIGDGSLLTNLPDDTISEIVQRLCIATETITKGQAVCITGGTGDNPNVSLTNASNVSLMPAIGIALENISSAASGNIALYGEVYGIDTTSFTVGQSLYVSASIAGALTNVAPAGETNLIQKIGKVVRSNANGIVMVQGAGRTNATPNLNSGNIFIGNGSNQSTTRSLDTLGQVLITSNTFGAKTLTQSQDGMFNSNTSGGDYLAVIAATNPVFPNGTRIQLTGGVAGNPFTNGTITSDNVFYTQSAGGNNYRLFTDSGLTSPTVSGQDDYNSTDAPDINYSALSVNPSGVTHTKDVVTADTLTIGEASQDDAVLTLHGEATFNTGNNSQTALTLAMRNSNSVEGPLLTLYKDNSNAAVSGDTQGHILFKGDNGSGGATNFARIESVVGTPTSGLEDGKINFKVMKAGTETSIASVSDNGIISNYNIESKDRLHAKDITVGIATNEFYGSSSPGAFGVTAVGFGTAWDDPFIPNGTKVIFSGGTGNAATYLTGLTGYFKSEYAVSPGGYYSIYYDEALTLPFLLGGTTDGGSLDCTFSSFSTVNVAGGPDHGGIWLAGNVDARANISATYFMGNGSLLTGIASGGISNADAQAYIESTGLSATAEIQTTSRLGGGQPSNITLQYWADNLFNQASFTGYNVDALFYAVSNDPRLASGSKVTISGGSGAETALSNGSVTANNEFYVRRYDFSASAMYALYTDPALSNAVFTNSNTYSDPSQLNVKWSSIDIQNTNANTTLMPTGVNNQQPTNFSNDVSIGWSVRDYKNNLFTVNGTQVIATSNTAQIPLQIDCGLTNRTGATGPEAGPVVALNRNSSSPADGDLLGQLVFQGREDDTVSSLDYATITAKAVVATSAGTNEGGILANVILNGTDTNIVEINSTGLTTAGNIEATGSHFFKGNGSLLTGITAGGSTDSFGTILVAGQTNIQATQANAQLTLAASGAITLTTAGNTVTIGGTAGTYGNAEVTNFLASDTSIGNIAFTGDLTVGGPIANVNATVTNFFGSASNPPADQIQVSPDPVWTNSTPITMNSTTNTNITFLNGNTYYSKSVGGGFYELYTDSLLTTPQASGLGSESPSGLQAEYSSVGIATATIEGPIFASGNIDTGSTSYLNLGSGGIKAQGGGSITMQSVRVTDFKANDPLGTQVYANTAISSQTPFQGSIAYVTGDKYGARGAPCYYDGTSWRYFSDDANVTY